MLKGLIVEAEYLCDFLLKRDCDTHVIYLISRQIRHHTVSFLTKLENEFTGGAVSNDVVMGNSSNKSEKLKGYGLNINQHFVFIVVKIVDSY
jgi:hypothetical protein